MTARARSGSTSSARIGLRAGGVSPGAAPVHATNFVTKSRLLTPAGAIADPGLLGSSFIGPSWDRWKAVLKAAYAERLTGQELVLFREVAGARTPPLRPVRELICVVGRRGGKGAIAAACASVSAINGGHYRRYLRPGEKAGVLVIAVDRAQSRILHRYVAASFRENPLLRNLVMRETGDSLELSNEVEIIIATNSFRAIRGRTIVTAILDEACFYRDESSANPDEELYRAILPGLATLPGSMLIAISSPYRKSGLVYSKYRSAFGKDDPNVLVVQGASRLFNPTLPQQIVDQALEEDPGAARAEWLGLFRDDLESFVAREVIDSSVVPGRHELPPVSGVQYFGFVDPSGGSRDSMTLAVAHASSNEAGATLDCVREVKPPFSPEKVVEEFACVLQSYGLDIVTGDRYGGEWPRERFKVHGITYKTSDKAKSIIYGEMLPLLNSGRIELLDHPKLLTQLGSLERRTGRGGSRDSIDHPPGGHDDISNAGAGALILAAQREVRLEYVPPFISSGRDGLSSRHFDPESGERLWGTGVDPMSWDRPPGW